MPSRADHEYAITEQSANPPILRACLAKMDLMLQVVRYCVFVAQLLMESFKVAHGCSGQAMGKKAPPMLPDLSEWSLQFGETRKKKHGSYQPSSLGTRPQPSNP